ncbi:dUTPase1 [bottlenose dolphin adenovirus 2]|uniref:dUTP diphosphatase n=1 Tax=bottlenose dolphin adenovirus 2 TaxID=2849592 RepID=A0A0M4M5B6_9ADEN|nr:dUTPase [Bottlenose dolphin adenovirus 1]ALE15314.1 dUTPase1 [Bottlenose dolphin adenovirus 1]
MAQSSSEFQLLKVKLLSANAKVPLRATEGAAGYDLFAASSLLLPANTRKLIPIDIALEIPDGHYGRIAPRSGLSVRHGIMVGAGVVDCDYRGNIHVLLFNLSNEDFHIKQGVSICFFKSP